VVRDPVVGAVAGKSLSLPLKPPLSQPPAGGGMLRSRRKRMKGVQGLMASAPQGTPLVMNPGKGGYRRLPWTLARRGGGPKALEGPKSYSGLQTFARLE
jgi:hypothetical protein